MRKLNRLTMTLALLIMAVGGAWAQSTLDVVEFDVPKAWETDNNPVTAGDLPGFKASTLDEAKAWTGAPAEGLAVLVYAFDGEEACFVPFTNGEAGQEAQDKNPKNEIFGTKSVIKYYYTTGPEPIELKPDETGKKWTLADMPASNIELQVEYYAESNLFLSKEALADKASIAVTAGDLGVQFGEDGKSANPVAEGTAMTVKYNGTKKILGMKVEKKAAPKLLTLNVGGDYPGTLTYAEGETWGQAIQNHPTENTGWEIGGGGAIILNTYYVYLEDKRVRQDDPITPGLGYYTE